MQRLSITVYGRVQGVGYRFFTCNCARKHRLSGWVRNRFDGSVDMEVQGNEDDLAAFRAAINQGPMLARVHEAKTVEVPMVDGEKTFAVRY